ncbi:hypothetical protein [Streptomyces cyslabdanicus]|uniref:hypothetical protein n=1 Tax=Streptomyces cyslabdanicus TaxID=1470456 RepID=UPI004043BF34
MVEVGEVGQAQMEPARADRGELSEPLDELGRGTALGTEVGSEVAAPAAGQPGRRSRRTRTPSARRGLTTARAHHDAAGMHLDQDALTALEKAAAEEKKTRSEGAQAPTSGGGRPSCRYSNAG